MLQAKVTDLRAPSQEQRIEWDHRWDVADADVRYVNASKTWLEWVSGKKLGGLITNLSSVSSSSMFKSQAMYSRAASVIRGHHDRSRARSFWRFSAISSTPSSVILLQPDNDSTVKCGSEWTEMSNINIKMLVNKMRSGVLEAEKKVCMCCE